MSIGERIRSLRMKKGLSLAELADRSGITEFSLSSIEKTSQPSLSATGMEAISAALHIPIDHLRSGKPADPATLDEEWKKAAQELLESGISKKAFKAFLAIKKQQKKKHPPAGNV